ncbi:MAG: GtrA family protein [Clostridia bacterium]|nr:GtrA family protein [Clostridia bacterium]
MENSDNKKNNIFQFIKFALFSASAGIIQVVSFTLMNELLMGTAFMQNLIAENETFAKIMTNEYGPFYLTALLLSVIWNFTFNRKFTFKSAANIPVAMLKVLGFYVIFTPVSTLLGNYFTAKFASVGAIEYIVLAVTMLCNMITEYLFCKFVVYKNQENTAVKAEDK